MRINCFSLIVKLRHFFSKGNKVDKDDEREVPERIGKSFATENGFDYFLETSALDSTNVDNLFQEVATRLTEAMEFNDERFASSYVCFQ